MTRRIGNIVAGDVLVHQNLGLVYHFSQVPVMSNNILDLFCLKLRKRGSVSHLVYCLILLGVENCFLVEKFQMIKTMYVFASTFQYVHFFQNVGRQ